MFTDEDELRVMIRAIRRKPPHRTTEEIRGSERCYAVAMAQLNRNFAGSLERLADTNAAVELRRWLDGAGDQLDWAGQEVAADEWFCITTLYGQRTRDQQRSLIRNYFPRFVRDCVGGDCFPIDNRVRKELERHRLPSGMDGERLLVSLSLAHVWGVGVLGARCAREFGYFSRVFLHPPPSVLEWRSDIIPMFLLKSPQFFG
jgi:hypothetical protein